ncbi:uncharacterized protein RCO7_14011 [Rhynchosporium graminicola]|uniref:Uncharacterized protein n=1 Tax=Rhynchosporium graminicola TaxID=2792576 RepID=A0A1E1JVM0_9HELO|nr:uncharacterized protein RCO7_14011 [Rhynchosporium commune]
MENTRADRLSDSDMLSKPLFVPKGSVSDMVAVYIPARSSSSYSDLRYIGYSRTPPRTAG